MRKKLIKVALPLEAINAESARKKSIRHDNPSTLLFGIGIWKKYKSSNSNNLDLK